MTESNDRDRCERRRGDAEPTMLFSQKHTVDLPSGWLLSVRFRELDPGVSTLVMSKSCSCPTSSK